MTDLTISDPDVAWLQGFLHAFAWFNHKTNHGYAFTLDIIPKSGSAREANEGHFRGELEELEGLTLAPVEDWPAYVRQLLGRWLFQFDDPSMDHLEDPRRSFSLFDGDSRAMLLDEVMGRLSRAVRPSAVWTVEVRTIRNCPLPVFREVCPRQWEALTPTDRPSVRHCGQCNQNVYLCSTDEETLNHARAGHCIAREIPDDSDLLDMYLGRPKYVPPPTAEQEEAWRLTRREQGINDALKNLRSPRCCPRCHYPAPSWRITCRVCGL